MTRLATLLVTFAILGTPAAAQDPIPARADIIEVSIVVVNDGFPALGQGWAFGDWTLDGRPCRVVTPFHVIQSEFGDGSIPADEIYVRGLGQGAEIAAFLLTDLSYADPDIDLAVLRLGRNAPCPFDPVDADIGPRDGLWLTRLDPETREPEAPWQLDARRGIVTAENPGRFVEIETADGRDISDGWSGSSVVLDGRRVAMVVESVPGGGRALPVAEMQRLWGERLNITDGPEVDDPVAARTALSALGYTFTPPGLVDAITTRDAAALTLFRFAGMPPETVLEAFALRVPGSDETALVSFFRGARDDPALMDWFEAELNRGLDPNGVVPGGHYDAEALLIAAYRTENTDAIRLLLEAGASPNPYQELDQTVYWSPRTLLPLTSVARMETVPLEERAAIARRLIDLGAVLPDAVMRKWDGTYAPFGPGDRGQRVARMMDDDLAALGISPRPTPDLCDTPRPAICETATRLYGRDWCTFVEELPKGFVGTGDGAYHLEPLTITHLMSIDAERAHFRAMSGDETSWSQYVLSIGPGAPSMSVTVLGRTYDCKPRVSDRHVPDTCWEERVFRPHPDGEGWKWGSWGASFRFYNLCAGSPDRDAFETERTARLAWQDDLRARTTELNLFTAALLRIRGGIDPDGALDELARDLQAAERRMAGNLEYTASQRSGILGSETLPALLSDPARRTALIDLYLGRPGTPFQDVLTDDILAHLPLGEPDMTLTAARAIVSDLVEIGLARMPDRLRLVSPIPDLKYADGAFVMARNQADKRLVVAPAAPRGEIGARIEIYGSSHWQRLPDGSGRAVLTDPRQALFWQPEDARHVLHLVDILDAPMPTRLPVDPEIAVSAMQANGAANRAEDWVFVSDLVDPRIHETESGEFVLKADLALVRLVASDGALVATFRPDELLPQ